MAHFCEIDSNNIVVQIVTVPNEQENRGEEYLSIDLGLGGRWIQTSYNNTIRNVYAGIGFTYDENLDIFISPKPFPSWTLSSEGFWEAPISRPTNPNKVYRWDEDNQEWDITDPIV